MFLLNENILVGCENKDSDEFDFDTTHYYRKRFLKRFNIGTSVFIDDFKIQSFFWEFYSQSNNLNYPKAKSSNGLFERCIKYSNCIGIIINHEVVDYLDNDFFKVRIKIEYPNGKIITLNRLRFLTPVYNS